MEKKSYNTKNRSMILEFLKANQEIMVSAKDILHYLQSNGVEVNRSTVYRYLNQLCSDKLAMKYVDNDEGKTVYQYVQENHDCDGHIHLKCVVCNQIQHLDCHFMDEIRTHLKVDHKFNLICDGSVMYGICDNCKKN